MKASSSRTRKIQSGQILYGLAMGIILISSGCASNNIEITLASPQERVPSPQFLAKDMSKKGQIPEYSHVRVYDVTEGCSIPGCQIVWHSVVSETTSPTKIHYGVLPSFGSITVVSPRTLRPGRKYVLTLGQEEQHVRSRYGSIEFYVNENGDIISAPLE
jgi:hypothetical protein